MVEIRERDSTERCWDSQFSGYVIEKDGLVSLDWIMYDRATPSHIAGTWSLNKTMIKAVIASVKKYYKTLHNNN
jgi:hypothetical protein